MTREAKHDPAAAGPGTAAWLLTESAPPPGPPSSPVVAEAIALAQACWQVLPTMERRIAAWADGSHVELEPLRNRAVALKAAGRIQLELCARLARDFASAGLDYALLKGAASRLMGYADPAERVSCDIDVGVRKADLGTALEVVLDNGFRPAQLDPERRRFTVADPAIRAVVEAGHYELGFLVRSQVVTGLAPEVEAAIRADMPVQGEITSWFAAPGDRLACYAVVDLHHGLSLDIALEPLLETAPAAPAGGLARVPRIDWHVFHLIFKLYWEGVHNYRQGLHQYADLVRIVPAMDEARCADLLALVEGHRFEAGAHYVLRRLASDLGSEPPAPLADFLAATRSAPAEGAPPLHNDLGDMWDKLWGYR